MLMAPVLLGLAFTGSTAQARPGDRDRPTIARDRPDRAPVVRPERLDRALERIRPGSEDVRLRRDGNRVHAERASRGSYVNRMQPSQNRGKELLGRANPQSRVACNEADECFMSVRGARAIVEKAARMGHGGSFVNKMQPGFARGQQFLGRANASTKMASAAATAENAESYMSPIGARSLWQKHATARDAGGSFVNAIQDKIEAKKVAAQIKAAMMKYNHAAER
jgi:hypothetical protein